MSAQPLLHANLHPVFQRKQLGPGDWEGLQCLAGTGWSGWGGGVRVRTCVYTCEAGWSSG